MPPRAPRPRPLYKNPEDMTDEELQAKGYTRVPIGPFGIFGSRIMTLRNFNKRQAARGRARQRRKKQRRTKAKKAVKRAVTGTPKKKRKKEWLGGLLYWD